MRHLLVIGMAASGLVAGRVEAAVTVTVVAPTDTPRVRDVVAVYVDVQTDLAITSAEVTLDGTATRLTAIGSCGTGCQRMSAAVSPVAPEGAKLITAQATDSSGATATATAPIVFDPPVVVTLAIEPGAIVGTSLRVRGTCDDGGAPCAAVDLTFSTYGAGISRTLQGVASFDELFDLTPVAGAQVTVTATGHDLYPGGEGQQATTIYVNNSPRLVPIVATGGLIADADLRRVLHTDHVVRSPAGVSIYDRSAAADRSLDPAGTLFGPGQLTPNGAAWQADNQVVVSRDGALSRFPGSGLRVAGGYATWQEPTTFATHWLDVVSGVETRIGGGIALPAANGVLHYVRSGTRALVRRDAAGEAVIASDVYPLATDGNLVVAFQLGGCGVDVYSPTAPVDHLDTAPCSTLQSVAWVRDGWVVYYGVVSLPTPPYAIYSLRSRAPDGTRYLLADDVVGIGVDDVSPGGEVMFTDRGRRFRVTPGAAPVDVASWLGRALWRDGVWLVVIGGTLFGIDEVPGIPPGPDGPPDGAPDAGPGSPDAGPGASDAGPDAGERPGGGLSHGGGCATGDPAPSALLGLAALGWTRRPRRRRA